MQKSIDIEDMLALHALSTELLEVFWARLLPEASNYIARKYKETFCKEFDDSKDYDMWSYIDGLLDDRVSEP
jgi:hypothetical protein